MSSAQGHITVVRKNYGEKGDKGEKGDTGAKGDKGDKGDTGGAGAKGADGIVYRYQGEYTSGTTYVYDTTYRDIVTYKGMYFTVYEVGVATAEPPYNLSVGYYKDNWLVFNDYKAIAADTAIINGGNIGGFSFTRIQDDDGNDKRVNGQIVGIMQSQSRDDDGKAMLSMNSETGEIIARRATIVDGDISVTGTDDDGISTTVEISPKVGGMKVKGDNIEKTTFTGNDKDIDDFYKGTGSDNVSIIRNSNYTNYRNDISTTSVSGGSTLKGSNQDSYTSECNLMNGMWRSSFAVTSRSLVTFTPENEDKGFVNIITNVPSNTAIGRYYNYTEFIVRGRKLGIVYTNDIYANYNTGENDGSNYRNIDWMTGSFGLMLEPDTYDIEVNSTMYAEIDMSTTSAIDMSALLLNFTVNIDPEGYSSDFFGNGVALGTSENHHFLTMSTGGIQRTEVLSGAAGIVVVDGTLQFRIGGLWYTLSVVSGALKLTQVSSKL